MRQDLENAAAQPSAGSSGQSEPRHGSDVTYLEAWFTTVQGLDNQVNMGYNGGSSATSIKCRVMPAMLALPEIHSILDKQTSGGEASALQALQRLNLEQRALVTQHVSEIQARLLSVDLWEQRQYPTIFGDLNLSTLFWITRRPIFAELLSPRFPPLGQFRIPPPLGQVSPQPQSHLDHQHKACHHQHSAHSHRPQ